LLLFSFAIYDPSSVGAGEGFVVGVGAFVGAGVAVAEAAAVGVVAAGFFVGVRVTKSSSVEPFLEQAASANSDKAQIAITINFLFNAISLVKVRDKKYAAHNMSRRCSWLRLCRYIPKH
jgi:tetrahydrodipicolinate N-succinyltransferase